MARKKSFRCAKCNKKGVNTRTHYDICSNYHISTLPCINNRVSDQNNKEEENNITSNTITKKQKNEHCEVITNNEMQRNAHSIIDNNIEIENTELNQLLQDNTTIISQESTKPYLLDKKI